MRIYMGIFQVILILPVLVHCQQATMNQSIVIIGAGAAGVAAAAQLMANGFRNVTILEAENRLGGRVNTVPYDANVLDMGAQWCHGEENNIVFEMASPFDLLDANSLDYLHFPMHRSDGAIIDESDAKALMRLGLAILDDEERMEEHNGSVGTFVMSKYKAALQTPRYANISANLATQFIEFFALYESSNTATDSWFAASIPGFLQYEECEGNDMLNWRHRGFGTVFKLLQNKWPGSKGPVIPVEERIRYNKEVSRIHWAPAADRQAAALVECADGSRFEADHVISTVSLGVLKERAASWFEPALPAAKLAAMDGLSLGTVDKIYVRFAQPFWPDSWAGFSLLWSAEDRAKLSEPDAWMGSVSGFYRVDLQPNVLCGWITGWGARWMEQLPEQEVYEAVARLFEQFVAPTLPVQPAVEIYRSQWYSNPHFRGSYTYINVRADELSTGPADLATPLTGRNASVPVVQFAGEATHPHFYSTVHGAIESGQREAKRLMDLYNVNSAASSNWRHNPLVVIVSGIALLLSVFGASSQ